MNSAVTSSLARMISPKELSRITGLAVVTLWRARKRGELPAPVRLTRGRIAWPEPVIAEWLQQRERAGQ